MPLRICRTSSTETVRRPRGSTRRLTAGAVPLHNRHAWLIARLALQRLPAVCRMAPVCGWALPALRGEYSDFRPQPGPLLVSDLFQYLLRRLLGAIATTVQNVLYSFPPDLRQDVEDITTEVWIVLSRRPPRTDGGNLTALIRAVARTQVIGRFRQTMRRVQPKNDTPVADRNTETTRPKWVRRSVQFADGVDYPARTTSLAEFDFDDSLNATLNALELDDFEIEVVRGRYHGESSGDTAERLGVLVKWVYQARSRIKKRAHENPRLAKLLFGLEEDPPDGSGPPGAAGRLEEET